MQIINFLDQHSGSLMVIITLIYVVATIGIFRENQKASKASKDQLAKTQQQLEESQKQFEITQTQFEEKKRREMMPCFFLSSKKRTNELGFLSIVLTQAAGVINAESEKVFVLENVGQGIAKDVVWIFHCKRKTGIIIESGWLLPPKSSMSKAISFEANMSDQDITFPYSGQFEIRCTDMNENEYSQLIEVEFVPVSEPGRPFGELDMSIKKITAPTLKRKNENNQEE